MLDFDKYAARHSEGYLLQLIEDAERRFGISTGEGKSLEDRWNFLMHQDVSQQRMAA